MKFIRSLGNIGMGILSMIVSVLLQLVLFIPVYIYYTTIIGIHGTMTDIDFLTILDQIANSIFSMDLAVYATVIWGICGIFVFSLWYKRISSTTPKVSFTRDLSGYTIFGIILVAVGAQLLVNYICNILSTYFVREFDQFAGLFDMTSLSTMASIIMLIYAIFIAPIHEEILFRGVILHYMRNGCPFILANILQALLFGLLHMNIVQGTYAFLVGLLLGYIFKRSKNLTSTIIIHIIFNIIGSFPILKGLPGNAISLNLIAAAIGAVILTIGCIVYNYYIKERDLRLSFKNE
ncbi:MAG: CPBP family intramembrane metalloprotease [Lachnospiraceae bacterium]|nr:CPBP family intramembrane metalloprotease [Lachnospiraceae bacterium]